MSLIRLNDVHVSFEKTPVLREAFFRLEAKERVGLIGRNGSGKSTLLKLALEQVHPDSGTVSSEAGTRWSTRRLGGEEMVWEGEHGLDRVPFAYFPGRTRNSREPAHRFHGLLDPVYGDIYALDTLRAQLASGVWQVAWPQPVLETDARAESTPGAGDRMAAALGVPVLLFDVEVDEILRWLADNRREQVYLASGWLDRIPA